jgi:hypothetical protein
MNFHLESRCMRQNRLVIQAAAATRWEVQNSAQSSAESAEQQSPGRKPRDGAGYGISPERAAQAFRRYLTTCVAPSGLFSSSLNPGFRPLRVLALGFAVPRFQRCKLRYLSAVLRQPRQTRPAEGPYGSFAIRKILIVRSAHGGSGEPLLMHKL